MIPISLASFLGPILFAKYFDLLGRKKMMFTSYMSSGVLLIITSILFANNCLNLTF